MDTDKTHSQEGQEVDMSTFFEEQIRRDIHHHKQRIKWLQSEAPRWSCGTPVSHSDRIRMLNASRRVLENPIEGVNTSQQNA